jgi:hypothetical protein
VAHYPGRPEFEANADRARESADTLLATSLAEQAERERRAEASATQRGPILAFVDRVRSVLGARLGR